MSKARAIADSSDFAAGDNLDRETLIQLRNLINQKLSSS